MKILTTTRNLCKRLFPETECVEIPTNPVFEQFQWDDKTCVKPVCVDVQSSGTDTEHTYPEYGILEEFSESSQFDRLRHWQGPAIFALAIDGKGFHGQHQRVWRTGAGNLYLSMAMPVSLPVSCAQTIQILPAHVVKSEINSLNCNHFEVDIKPPNDVVIRLISGPKAGIPHKIAGTLTDLRVCGDTITQVRYGIGMNLMHAPTQTDPGHLPAIALNELVSPADPDNSFQPLIDFMHAILCGICAKLNDIALIR